MSCEPSPSGSRAVGEAPGRLDLLGGVSDYSGARVLQAAISLQTTVVVQETRKQTEQGRRKLEIRSQQFGDQSLDLEELECKGKEGLSSVRDYLFQEACPKWVGYVVGTFCAFCNRFECYPQVSLEISVDSQVPPGQGVSSSASVEIATVQALRRYTNLQGTVDEIEFAVLAQKAENVVVGASCGIMDQIACLLGSYGSILPINCMHRTVSKLVYLPDDTALVGFPSKVQHDLSDNSPYERARTSTAMAAKMAQKVLPHLSKLSDIASISLPFFDKHIKSILPHSIRGKEFLKEYDSVEDELSRVIPEEVYCVLDAMEFAVQSNFFSSIVMTLLESVAFSERSVQQQVLSQVGEMMLMQHQSYSKIGLGHFLTDQIVDLLMSFGPKKGIYGARTSGGGSGGTIVILCDQAALPIIQEIANEYKTNVII